MAFGKSTFVIALLCLVAFSSLVGHAAGKKTSQAIYQTSTGLTADEPNYYEIYGNYTKEFMRGAKIIPRIPSTEECIKEVMRVSKEVIEDYQRIQKQIKNNGLTFESYLDYTITIGKAQPTIKTCFDPNYQFFDETHQWLSHFKSTWSFIWKFTLNQFYSGYRWFEIVKAWNQAYSKKDNNTLSFIAGKAAYVLVDFDEELRTPQELNQLELSAPLDIALFIERLASNVLVGAFDLVYNFLDGAKIFEPKSADVCENGIKDYKKAYRDAIDDIKKKTYESMKNGFFQIADLLGDFHTVNEKCISGVQAAIDRVNEYKRMRSAPLEILRNFIWNHKKVYKHMMQTVECLFNLDSKCIGFSSGQLFYEIFAKH